MQSPGVYITVEGNNKLKSKYIKKKKSKYMVCQVVLSAKQSSVRGVVQTV